MMSGGSVAQPRVVDLPLYSIRADCWANYRRILVNVAGDGELDSRASSALPGGAGPQLLIMQST